MNKDFRKFSLLALLFIAINSPSLAEEKSVSATPDLHIINLDDANDPGLKLIESELGIDVKEWVEEQRNFEKLLAANTVIELESDELTHVDQLLTDAEATITDPTKIKERLKFEPKLLTDQANFKILSLEESGGTDGEKFDGLSTIYDSPYGKLMISEQDLSFGAGSIFTSKNALNTQVGVYPAMLAVKKAKDKEAFESTLDWVNTKTHRAYTVTLNKNLHDDKLKQERADLFELLGKNYGE